MEEKQTETSKLKQEKLFFLAYPEYFSKKRPTIIF